MSLISFIKRTFFSQFIFYMLFAGVAALIDTGLLFVLTEFLGIYYLVSSVVSYLCGMITNYSLNKVFNFKDKSPKIAQQFVLFAFVAIIGLILNQIILFILVENIHVWYIFAKIISLFVVVIWSFFGHKKITFSLLK